MLGQSGHPVRSIDIVNELGYSKPSVSVAMKKLRENNLITVDGDGYIHLTEDGLAVRWTGCACPEATLTIYRDGWPVLVSSVRGIDGSFDVPLWYTQEAGDYAAQLRCMDGCARVEAGSVAPPMEEGPVQTEVCPSQSAGDAATPAPTEKPT